MAREQAAFESGFPGTNSVERPFAALRPEESALDNQCGPAVHLDRMDMGEAVNARNVAVRLVRAHQPVDALNGGEARIDRGVMIRGHFDEGAEERPAAPKHS